MLILSFAVRRIAFLALLALAGVTTAACIFDDGGDYTGGGRRDIGAKLNQGDQLPEEDAGGTGTDTDSGSSPFPDTGTGG